MRHCQRNVFFIPKRNRCRNNTPRSLFVNLSCFTKYAMNSFKFHLEVSQTIFQLNNTVSLQQSHPPLKITVYLHRNKMIKL